MSLQSAKHDPRARRALGILCIALLTAAVFVRGLTASVPPRPDEDGEHAPRLGEAMQLLQAGAELRAGELDELVSEGARVTFRAQRRVLFALDTCPPLVEWLDTKGGQHLELQVAELRRGTPEEAFCALVFIFELARSTRWEPGWGGTTSAERLGLLLQDWLKSWGDSAAEHALLFEPSFAAALLYGRCMRAAVEAPVMGRNQGPYDRARNFLWELCGTGTRRRTAFGRALAQRHPRAIEVLESEDDFLLGFEEEARALLPDLEGECEPK